MSEMIKEAQAVKDHQAAVASGAKSEDDPIELDPTPAAEPEVTVEDPQIEEPAAAAAEPAEEIIVGDRSFTDPKEALAYARELAREKDLLEARQSGIQEALEATRGGQQTQTQAPPEEDNFEEQFYSNPKETLQKVAAKAKQDAVSEIRAEIQREQMWTTFLTQYPDIERSDAERILRENWDTLGKMTDVPKAMTALATKTRAYYQGIVERMKPRTQLPDNKRQAVSPAGGAPARVTPAEAKKPLSFAEEMRQLHKGR